MTDFLKKYIITKINKICQSIFLLRFFVRAVIQPLVTLLYKCRLMVLVSFCSVGG